jgi:hypothetical protein
MTTKNQSSAQRSPRPTPAPIPSLDQPSGNRRTVNTPVKFEDLMQIAKEIGLSTEEKKSGWVKIKAAKGPARLYVPVSKRGEVTRVDVSELPASFGIVPPTRKNGRVNGHLAQEGMSQEDILTNFRLLCMVLAGERDLDGK